MSKKWICLLMASILVCAPLAGCGTEKIEQETPPAQSTAVQEEQPPAEEKVLVVYFSATGNTDRAAGIIAEATGGTLLQLEPKQPYTDADLDYLDEQSRVCREHDNPALRQVELERTEVADWDSISVVYLGYPIWWGEAAWPVESFVKANDFAGKTVIPFCTSASSGMGESGTQLAELAAAGDWREGKRFSSSASEEEILEWIQSLEF